MRKLLPILLFICLANSGRGQASTQNRVAILKRQVEKNHVAARPLDDAFSTYVFEQFLAQIDPDQDLFTRQEFQSFLPFKTRLDEEIRGESWEFLNLVTRIYGFALIRADSLVNLILEKPLELQADEQAVFHRD